MVGSRGALTHRQPNACCRSGRFLATTRGRTVRFETDRMIIVYATPWFDIGRYKDYRPWRRTDTSTTARSKEEMRIDRQQEAGSHTMYAARCAPATNTQRRVHHHQYHLYLPPPLSPTILLSLVSLSPTSVGFLTGCYSIDVFASKVDSMTR